MKILIFSAILTALSSPIAVADNLRSVEVTNTFAAPGIEMLFAETPTVDVTDGVEFSPFLLYDIDVSDSQISFVLSDNSINNVGVDQDSADVYYLKFDKEIISAEVTEMSDNFNLEIVLYEVDTTLTFPATFDMEKGEPVMNNPGLVMENGGLAIRILEGTTLTDEDLGGKFVVSITTAN